MSIASSSVRRFCSSASSSFDLSTALSFFFFVLFFVFVLISALDQIQRYPIIFCNGKDPFPSQEPAGSIMWRYTYWKIWPSRWFLFECDVNRMACPEVHTAPDVFVPLRESIALPVLRVVIASAIFVLATLFFFKETLFSIILGTGITGKLVLEASARLENAALPLLHLHIQVSPRLFVKKVGSYLFRNC